MTRVLGSKKTWAAATVGVAVIGTLAAAVVLGSHLAVGLTPTNLVPSADFEHAVHLNSDRVKLQTKGATDVRIQNLVFAANSTSGWHHHPGVVLVTVQSGSVTVTESDCTSTTYGPGLPAGAVFAEGGDDPMRATSAGGANAYVVFIVPNGEPFRIDDHDFPGCP
jgi:quercetin dioxygenase-like cupin family protein